MFKTILIIVGAIVLSFTFYIGYSIGTSIWDGFEAQSTVDPAIIQQEILNFKNQK